MARGVNNLFDDAFLRKLEQLHLLAKRLAAHGSAGRRRAKRLGDGLEFADHRDYSAGDDLRFVDWSYYARMEKLLLRLFHEHSEGDVCILMDCSASMAASGQDSHATFAYALRVAAALAYVAMGGLERVTIQPFAEDLTQPLRTGRNRGQILAVLDYLGGLTPAGKTQLARSAERLARQGGPRGTVILISDLLDCSEELAQACMHLQAGNDLVVLQIFGPADARPVIEGQMVLQQAETGQELALEVTPELLASYSQQWEAFRRACEHTVVGRGGTYLAAATDTPFEDLVLKTLRRAGVIE